jgi:signal transduction histidine kinase
VTVVAMPDKTISAPPLRRFSAPALTPGLWAGLWAALVVCVVVVVWGTATGTDDVDPIRTTFRLVGAAFVACGLIAWRRRPDSYSGLLMTATGFLLFVEPLFAQFDSPQLHVAGDVLEDLWSITIIWLVLTMLSGGRLTATIEKVLVGAFVLEFALEVTWHLFLDEPGNFLLVSGDDDVAAAIDAAIGLLVSAACVATAVLIGVRYKRASRAGRRALLPSVMGITCLLFFAVVQQAEPIWLQWLAVLSLLTIPAGFLVGLLSSRLARGGLADLFRRLPTMRSEELQPALAQALGDPTLAIVRGNPDVGPGRSCAPIDDDTVLVYDASLDDDPEMIEAATSAAAIALESRARLERIVTAGDDERRRLERNLHDGAQQRLVALAMQLRLVQHEIHSDPAAAQALVDTASRELALSLEELRELARGIHPAVLDHGLEPALHSLAGQATVPTAVAYDAEGRLPEPIELAAYFVTSEALANVGKYARAKSASVRVARGDGALVVEIADDGIGGADAARGSGLRGLADRVEALDGRLRVVSPPGAGTVVRAELPCGS